MKITTTTTELLLKENEGNLYAKRSDNNQGYVFHTFQKPGFKLSTKKQSGCLLEAACETENAYFSLKQEEKPEFVSSDSSFSFMNAIDFVKDFGGHRDVDFANAALELLLFHGETDAPPILMGKNHTVSRTFSVQSEGEPERSLCYILNPKDNIKIIYTVGDENVTETQHENGSSYTINLAEGTFKVSAEDIRKSNFSAEQKAAYAKAKQIISKTDEFKYKIFGDDFGPVTPISY